MPPTPPKNPTTVGDRLLYLRLMKGYTQAHLAHLSGVSAHTISRIEKGGNCYASTLGYLAPHLNTSTDWLLGRTQSRSPLPTCEKPFCGTLAAWAVQTPRRRLPAKCCDDHLTYYLGRDHDSAVAFLAAATAEKQAVG